MPFTTGDISIQLLMDTTAALQEIEARMSTHAFGAVHIPDQAPAVRHLLELLPAMDPAQPVRVVRVAGRRWEHCWHPPRSYGHRLVCPDF
jgi:hypothetical protein